MEPYFSEAACTREAFGWAYATVLARAFHLPDLVWLCVGGVWRPIQALVDPGGLNDAPLWFQMFNLMKRKLGLFQLEPPPWFFDCVVASSAGGTVQSDGPDGAVPGALYNMGQMALCPGLDLFNHGVDAVGGGGAS